MRNSRKLRRNSSVREQREAAAPGGVGVLGSFLRNFLLLHFGVPYNRYAPYKSSSYYVNRLTIDRRVNQCYRGSAPKRV